MNNQIFFYHLPIPQQQKYIDRLFHEDERIRILWASFYDIHPSLEQYERGLSDLKVAVRLAWIKRSDFTPNAQQYERGLVDGDPLVRIAFLQKHLPSPTPAQYERGLTDENPHVRKAWVSKQNVRLPIELTRQQKISLIDASLENATKESPLLSAQYIKVIRAFFIAKPKDSKESAGLIIDHLDEAFLSCSWVEEGLELYTQDGAVYLICVEYPEREHFHSNAATIEIMETTDGRENKYWRLPIH